MITLRFEQHFRRSGAAGKSVELLLLQRLARCVAAEVDARDAAAAYLGRRAQPRHTGHRQEHQMRPVVPPRQEGFDE